MKKSTYPNTGVLFTNKSHSISVYQKFLQMKNTGVEMTGVPSDLVRCEYQVKTPAKCRAFLGGDNTLTALRRSFDLLQERFASELLSLLSELPANPTSKRANRAQDIDAEITASVNRWHRAGKSANHEFDDYLTAYRHGGRTDVVRLARSAGLSRSDANQFGARLFRVEVATLYRDHPELVAAYGDFRATIAAVGLKLALAGDSPSTAPTSLIDDGTIVFDEPTSDGLIRSKDGGAIAATQRSPWAHAASEGFSRDKLINLQPASFVEFEKRTARHWYLHVADSSHMGMPLMPSVRASFGYERFFP
jgi:hypothetical protein